MPVLRAASRPMPHDLGPDATTPSAHHQIHAVGEVPPRGRLSKGDRM
jgi:hypothetical protein